MLSLWVHSIWWWEGKVWNLMRLEESNVTFCEHDSLSIPQDVLSLLCWIKVHGVAFTTKTCCKKVQHCSCSRWPVSQSSFSIQCTCQINRKYTVNYSTDTIYNVKMDFILLLSLLYHLTLNKDTSNISIITGRHFCLGISQHGPLIDWKVQSGPASLDFPVVAWMFFRCFNLFAHQNTLMWGVLPRPCLKMELVSRQCTMVAHC